MKDKLDAIFKAFESYIREQDYFDIVCSEKIGYVRFLVHEPGGLEAEALNTPEEMLGVLFNDIINDVIYSTGNPAQEHEHLVLTEYEETESRRQITTILETMEDEDKARYLDCLDKYIREYQENGARMQKQIRRKNGE